MILLGDNRDTLKTLPDCSVHCCVTSPPYWGLRDYGTAEWDGGDDACDHKELRGGVGESSKKQVTSAGASTTYQYRDTCRKCGATRIDRQLGLEKTPEEYVANMVQVFREVRRVLRDDGTLWLNLGTSYCAHPGQRKTTDKAGQKQRSNFASTGTPSRSAVDDSGSILSPLLWRAPACGTDGKAPPSFPTVDRACRDSCGELQGETLTHRDDIVHSDLCDEQGEPPPSLTDRDNEHSDCEPSTPSASPLDARASTTQLSYVQLPDASFPSTTAAAGQQEPQTSAPDAPRFSDNSVCTSGTSPTKPPLVVRTEGKESFFSACGRSDCNGIGKCGLCWCSLAIPSLNIKPKDEINIPHLVAMALQADGWILRQTICWAKPNPMPESVTDRPTKAHEYLFLLSKSQRYYYDAEAIKEPATNGNATGQGSQLRVDRVPQPRKPNGNPGVDDLQAATSRNRRSVWTVATQSYSGAHFATFPPKLIEPCILAGTSDKGCCPQCGNPWERVTQGQQIQPVDYNGKHAQTAPNASGRRMLANVRARRQAGNAHDNPFPPKLTTGWQPTCACHTEPVPCTVLDPFGGSGTTAGVAQAFERQYILCELSPQYAQLIPARIQSIVDWYYGRATPKTEPTTHPRLFT